MLFAKAIDVTFWDSPKLERIEYFENLYEDSQADPMMYNLGLKHFLYKNTTPGGSGKSESLEDFIQEKMENWVSKIDKRKDPNLWKAEFSHL